MANKRAFALFMEQGTGKTRCTLEDMDRLYSSNEISGALIIAPNGVHLNWITELDKWAGYSYVAECWKANAGKGLWKAFNARLQRSGEQLQIMAMNVDALATPKGLDYATAFCKAHDALLVIDESSRIKNEAAKRTKNIVKLGKLAKYRRILTGTPITQSPFDIYPQLNFLDPEILGFKSFYAFKNRYAKLALNRSTVAQVESALTSYFMERGEVICDFKHTLGQSFSTLLITTAQGEKGEITATLVKKTKGLLIVSLRRGNQAGEFPLNIRGNTWQEIQGYQKLDELRAKMAPHVYRVLKADCLDLPDKIYSILPVVMGKMQTKLYNELVARVRVELAQGDVTVAMALTKLLRIQQVVGGYVNTDDGITVEIKDNTRIKALVDYLQDTQGKVIIWARFRAELEAIANALEEEYGKGTVCQYHGGVSNADRAEAVNRLQGQRPIVKNGERIGWEEIPEWEQARFFVGNPHSGGLGLTLTAATTTIYYSNDFSLETRLQSEDRNHRIGTTEHINYVDMQAEGTVDKRIIDALRAKKDIASVITGDELGGWL